MVEQYYIDKYDSINDGLNSKRAYRTKTQRQEQQKKLYYKHWERRKKQKRKINKKSYDKHKERINKERKKKHKCNRCGCIVRFDGLRRHQKTKRCQRLSKQQSIKKNDLSI